MVCNKLNFAVTVVTILTTKTKFLNELYVYLDFEVIYSNSDQETRDAANMAQTAYSMYHKTNIGEGNVTNIGYIDEV